MRQILLLFILFFPFLLMGQTTKDSVKVKPFEDLTLVTDGTVDTSDQFLQYDISAGLFSYRMSLGEMLKKLIDVPNVVGSSQIVNGSILDTDISGAAGIGLNKLATTGTGRLLLTDSGGSGTWEAGTPGYGLSISGTSIIADTSSASGLVSKSRLTNALDDISGGTGSVSTISNNANGSYEHDNGNGVVTTFGYLLTKSGDTVQLRDQDSTIVDFVVVTGSAGGGVKLTTSGATPSADFSSNLIGVVQVDLSGQSRADLTLSNPATAGRYIIHFYNSTGTNVFFQNGWVDPGFTSMPGVVVDSTLVVDAYFGGTNYVALDYYTGFDTLNTNGLVYWLDSDTLSLTSGFAQATATDSVKYWIDRIQGDTLTAVGGGPVFSSTGLDFDGTINTKLANTDDSFLPQDSSARTVIVYIEGQSFTAGPDDKQSFFGWGTNSAGGNRFFLKVVDQDLLIDYYLNANQNNTTISNINTANMFAVSMANSGLMTAAKLYVNDTQITTVLADPANPQYRINTQSDVIEVGAIDSSQYYTAKIRDILVYNRQLSATEITEIKNYLDAQ